MMDVGVEFDFESYVKSVNDAKPKRIISPLDTKAHTVVCIHWLQGLCQKMEKCEFLHKLDKTKMPPCKHGSKCRTKNCLKKHESDEEKDECPFFLQGFCMHGPFCKYRHIKRPPDECPDEVDFVELFSTSKKRKATAPNLSYKISICKHWLEGKICPFGDGCIFAHGEEDLKSASFHDDIDDDNIYDPIGPKMIPAQDMPAFTEGNSTFFVLQAPDLVSLARGMARGAWSANGSTVRELSVAKEKSEHVVLFFSVNTHAAIYAMAELDHISGPILLPDDPNALSMNFPVKWMRTYRLSVRTTYQLRMGNGMHLGKLENDGRMDPAVGFELLLMSYRKPEWEWVAEIPRAQSGPTNKIPMKDLVEAAASIKAEREGDANAALTPLFPSEWIAKTARNFMTGSRLPQFPGPRHNIPTAGGNSGGFQGSAAVGPPGGGDFYPGIQPGFVVGCTAQTFEECFQRMLFGLPIQLQNDARMAIQPGTPLFLQDVNSNLLHGLFVATSPAIVNMEPKAFTQGGMLRESQFPVHVKFDVVLKAPMLPEFDSEVMAVFAGRRSGQRIGPLPLPATKRLSNIFAFRAGAWTPPGAPVGPGGPINKFPPAGGRPPPGGGMYGPGGGPSGGAEGQVTSMYRPPFRFTETVMVDIPFQDNGYQVKSRVLGVRGVNILNLITDLGTTQSSLKLRLRGRGSGYREGPEQMELNEPMQFCVSADSDELLHRAIAKLTELLGHARSDLSSAPPRPPPQFRPPPGPPPPM